MAASAFSQIHRAEGRSSETDLQTRASELRGRSPPNGLFTEAGWAAYLYEPSSVGSMT